MQVTVLYFAQLRERCGRAADSLELPADGDVATALAMVAKRHPHIAPHLPRVQVAVNQVVVAATTLLREGDELALIPPVAGGAAIRISIGDAPLQMALVVEAVVGHQVEPRAQPGGSPEADRAGSDQAGVDLGGLVTFTGIVRRKGHVPDVVRLEYEAYSRMAEKVLTEIADEIEHEIAGARVAIHHRVGSLAVGEAAVIVAAGAPNRAEAFAACRAAIDRLKQRAPIWKKEIGESGAAWIENCC